MADTVQYERAAGLATITLNRPEAMNSLNTETKIALAEAVQRAAEDPEVRAVLLTGIGRAFCVGQDLKEHVNELNEGGSGPTLSTVAEHYNPIVTATVLRVGPDPPSFSS